VSTRPRALKSRDKIAILAPAGRAARPGLLARAAYVVESMGMVPQVGAHASATHGFSAGLDQDRASDFNLALQDESIACIWALTGGFGALPLLDKIDYGSLAAAPKIIIGGDDVCHLLLACHKMTGVTTFCGPNLEAIDSKHDVDRLKKLLINPDIWPECKAQDTANLDFAYCPVPGEGKGKLLASNLTALVSLFGTPYEPDLAGHFVLIEDKNERNDILDRWFTTLYASGKLSQTVGLGVGQLVNCGTKGATNMLSFEELIADRVMQMRLATAFGFPFGQSGDCNILPLGASISFHFQKNTARLHYNEPVLA
jgi:muramoyltetrapeptide carboxypeptidase